MADRFALFVRDAEECKKATTRARLALYALAARANESGYCWPSAEQMMEDTGMSRASVFRALTEVREILTVDAPGYKKSNSYIFPFQEKKEAAGKRKKAAGGMAGGAAVGKTLVEGDGGKKKLSTKGKKAVDNCLKLRLGQSQIETGSLKLRPQGSQIETGGGLKLRPEVERGRIQEVSLSLTLPQTRSAGGSNVDNSSKSRAKTADARAYDGTAKPKTQEDMEKIKFWCAAAGLDAAHTTDFLRINRLAHWRQIDATTTVCDLIADFAFKWKKDDPDGYFYFNDKRKGIRRG